ncbi:hypothetical protein HJC23_000033 [Cyclotella cryptica]|uniref:WD40 repeat-like protein n=1 Tax=Cyclotella cryptica TaxID=29204 RepID=A0ABD3P226_9STRA|eukprot:CCRYP_018418-RA/>CCRYP_018418-RA protein AED:0.15 eAED:-0.13 QI:0/-1/0/1/-1/1/1/0/761
MKLFRFTSQSQKEYDGPAASAPMSSLRRPPSTSSGSVPANGVLDVSAHKAISLGSSITTSIGSTEAAERGGSLRRRARGSGNNVNESATNNGSNSNHTKETPSEDTRSKSKKIDRSQPLAPGISSRRTTKRVERHLPASKMTGNRNHNRHPRCNLQSIDESHSDSRSHDTYSIAGIPMDHDGGVTCITPLPSSSSSSSTSSHRFLTGGVDGTVQLWTIYDNPNIDPRHNQELKPRLIRKYIGHTGYIHQMARLGWFDPKARSGQDGGEGSNGSELSYETGGASTATDIKDRNNKRRRRELFVSASRDNTLRIWELDGEDRDYEGDHGTVQSWDTTHHSNPAKSKKELGSKGRKLRGHVFGGKDHGQAISGVLCVCSVPSLSNRGGISLHTAGQFVSGGSDGILRVWDVRSALNLDRVPKSGVYSTVQIQSLEKDRISVLKDVEDEKDDVDGEGRGRKNKDNNAAVPITAVICTGNTLSTVALFAADALGTIRRYSPMNQSPIGYVNNSIWWQFTGYFSTGTHSVTSLTILNSPDLAKLVCDESTSGDNVTLLASASSDGSISVWNASDAFIEPQMDGSEAQNLRIDRKKMKREALWKVHVNNDEDMGGETSKSASVTTCHNHGVAVTSLATIQGRRLTAGTNDGAIHIWDIPSESLVGSYTFGSNIQIWSLTVLSEVMYQAENEVVCVSIIVSGDNRGRIRALKNVLSDQPASSTESDAQTNDGEESLFEELFRGHSSHTSLNYSMGGSSSRRRIREVDFG